MYTHILYYSLIKNKMKNVLFAAIVRFQYPQSTI